MSISLNRISIPFRVKGPQDIPSFLYLIHRHNQSRCNYLSERTADGSTSIKTELHECVTNIASLSFLPLDNFMKNTYVPIVNGCFNIVELLVIIDIPCLFMLDSVLGFSAAEM